MASGSKPTLDHNLPKMTMRSNHTVLAACLLSLATIVLSENCGDVTLSIPSHFPLLENCTSMRSLTIAWNTPQPLQINLGVEEIQTDLYIFALGPIDTISFGSLTRIGGSLKITALQPSVSINSTVFHALQYVGGAVAVGDSDSHAGSIGASRFLATEGLTIGTTLSVGGLTGSFVDLVQVSRALAIGADSVTSNAIYIATAGTIRQVLFNTQFVDLQASIWGLVHIETIGDGSIHLVLLGAIRVLGGGLSMTGSSIGSVMVNSIIVEANQPSGICGGIGILGIDNDCDCWITDPVRCTTDDIEGLGTPILDPNMTSTESNPEESILEMVLFDVLPMWALMAGVGGLLLFIIIIVLCRLRCKRSHRYKDKHTEMTVAGITEIGPQSGNIADLMWDDGRAARQSKDSGGSASHRGPANHLFTRSMKRKAASTSQNSLMPAMGSVTFDAPADVSPPPLNAHLLSANGSSKSFTNSLPNHARGGSFYNGPAAPPRPSLSIKRPSGGNTISGDSDSSIYHAQRRPTPQVSRVGGSPMPQGVLVAGIPGASPRKKTRSRKSMRAAALRRPAQLARRHTSLSAVEESDLEETLDGHEFDDEGEEDPGYEYNGTENSDDPEDLDMLPSTLSREPTSGSQTSDISFISATDGTASEVGDLVSLDDLPSLSSSSSSSLRPPPIALGRHPSLKHAPAGLLNAVIEQERKKNEFLDTVYGSTGAPPSSTGTTSNSAIDEDVYEVPAMARSPRTGRSMPHRATVRNQASNKSVRQSLSGSSLPQRSHTQRRPPTRSTVAGSSMRNISAAGGGRRQASVGGSMKQPAAPPRLSIKRSSGGGSTKLPTAPPRTSLKRPNSMQPQKQMRVSFSSLDECAQDDEENPYLLPAVLPDPNKLAASESKANAITSRSSQPSITKSTGVLRSSVRKPSVDGTVKSKKKVRIGGVESTDLDKGHRAPVVQIGGLDHINDDTSPQKIAVSFKNALSGIENSVLQALEDSDDEVENSRAEYMDINSQVAEV